MSEQVHICPSCGEPVDLDNYYMKQVGAVTEINSAGHSYPRPVYRMAHFTCPCVMGRKATEKKENVTCQES